jgi:hypothetical protein
LQQSEFFNKLLEAKVVFLLDRSEEEIQAIDGHPVVRSASEQIRKALEAATGWRMRKQGGIPKKQFKLAAAFEDALGQLKEAYISATLEYLSRRPRPRSYSRAEPRLQVKE